VVRQLAEKPLAVVVTPEDLRSAVAAAGNMIDGVSEIDAWWVWHGGKNTIKHGELQAL